MPRARRPLPGGIRPGEGMSHTEIAREQLMEKLYGCARLAMALIDQGQSEVIIKVTGSYSFVQIALGQGSTWTGAELHSIQEFLYEHNAKMNLRHDHYGTFLNIWPDSAETATDEEPG